MNIHRNVRILIIALTLALAVAAGLVIPTLAAPIPPSGTPAVTNMSPRLVTLYSGTTTQSVTLGNIVVAGQYGLADVQYIIGMGVTAVNTTTLSLKHSNDRTNWVSSINLGVPVTSSTDLTRVHNFAYWTALGISLANNNPVTLTVVALFR